jgi:photosystem II stability/assembly factor-like uncharacterized protein
MPSRTNKRIGIDQTVPAFNDRVLVAWNGEDVLGAKAGAASAFALSQDNGMSWTDRSLIDSGYPYAIDDIHVTPDGSMFYVCANDGNETSLYRKSGPSWGRVLTLNNANGYIVRGAPDNNDTIYVADTGATAILFSSEAGDNRWYGYTATAALTDLAAESTDVCYIGTGANVRRSVNSGFTWGPPLSPELDGTNVSTISSLGEDRVIVGGINGHVSYTTDAGDTWATIVKSIATFPPTAGNIAQVTATGLDAGDYIYAAGAAGGNSVYRFTVGDPPPTDWKVIGPGGGVGAGHGARGMILENDALYILTANATPVVQIQRCLNPDAPAGWEWSQMVDAAQNVGAAPSVLKASAGSTKLWYATTVGAGGVRSYIDTLADTSPQILSPEDGFVNPVNPVTGRSVDIAYNWLRPSINANVYDIEIYTDPNGLNRVAQIAVGSPGPKAVVLVGPYQVATAFEWVGGQTYYWRTRVSPRAPQGPGNAWTGPIYSQWSEMRTITVEAGAASVPSVASPVNGGTITSTKPAFSWSPVVGATLYEFQLAADTTFASPLAESELAATGIAPDVTLTVGQTYFWRVRAVEPNVGNWSTIANFTVAEPVGPEKPPQITVEPAEIPDIVIPDITVPPAQVTVEQPTAAEPAISEGLLLAIIIIGAVLVIALIVLIVRTRRTV